MSRMIGEIPTSMVEDLTSCPLAGKRVAYCTDAVKPVSAEKDHGPRGTCEYLRQRENSSDVEGCDFSAETCGISSTGLTPILPPSQPVKIGKRAIDIKHCCVSPCDSLPGDARGLKLKEGRPDLLKMNAMEHAINDTYDDEDKVKEDCGMGVNGGFGRFGSNSSNCEELDNTTVNLTNCDKPKDDGCENVTVSDCDATGCLKKGIRSSGDRQDQIGCRRNHNCLEFSEKISCNGIDENRVKSSDDSRSLKNSLAATSRGDCAENTSNDPCWKSYDANNNRDVRRLCGSQSLCAVPVIDSLPSLVAELHRIFEEDNVSVEYVEAVMRAYKSDPREWRRYAKFDRYKYTRNLVDAGNDKFNLMILCWGEGHGSSVHDHADAHCFMKMLDGSLMETRYAWPSSQQDSEQPLTVLSKSQLNLNDVCYINDSLGLHRVENSSYSDRAVSLHLYSPPFQSCSVFNERTGHKTISRVTFWSMFGKRNKASEQIEASLVQEMEDN